MHVSYRMLQIEKVPSLSLVVLVLVAPSLWLPLALLVFVLAFPFSPSPTSAPRPPLLPPKKICVMFVDLKIIIIGIVLFQL